jgi:hypothetical protein
MIALAISWSKLFALSLSSTLHVGVAAAAARRGLLEAVVLGIVMVLEKSLDLGGFRSGLQLWSGVNARWRNLPISDVRVG